MKNAILVRDLKYCLVLPVREINIDSIQAPEPRTREEFLQCESQCLSIMFTPEKLKNINHITSCVSYRSCLKLHSKVKILQQKLSQLNVQLVAFPSITWSSSTRKPQSLIGIYIFFSLQPASQDNR